MRGEFFDRIWTGLNLQGDILMIERISIKQEASVAGNYDVVVCGGEPAGIMAAVTAAKNGARTALIERYGFLGGMATAGYVLPISEFCNNAKQVIGGLPWDFVKLLETMQGAEIEYPIGNIPFNPETYKLAAQRMVLDAGITLYLHSYISGCVLREKTITRIVINNKNGTEVLEGRYFIDCTGHQTAMEGVEGGGKNLVKEFISFYPEISSVRFITAGTPQIKDKLFREAALPRLDVKKFRETLKQQGVEFSTGLNGNE
jgi:hypothetical protein